MTSLTKKKSKFEWAETCEKSFEELKDRLTSAPMLTLSKCGKNYIVYCDASRVGLGCVLTQGGKVIAYTSRQLKVHEKNYPTHELELAYVMFALKLWRHYLHMDVFTYHNSLQYMFTQRVLSLRHRRWLELLKDYDMSFHYHPGKENVVVDALSRLSMGSKTHIDDGKKELVEDVHRLATLGVGLMTSTSGVSVHSSSKSPLVVEVKKGQDLDPVLMELKESVLVNMSEFFAMGGDGIHRYQDMQCVPDVDDLRTKIVAEAHGSRYLIHPGSTKMYNDLKQIYWWDGMKKYIA